MFFNSMPTEQHNDDFTNNDWITPELRNYSNVMNLSQNTIAFNFILKAFTGKGIAEHLEGFFKK